MIIFALLLAIVGLGVGCFIGIVFTIGAIGTKAYGLAVLTAVLTVLGIAGELALSIYLVITVIAAIAGVVR